MDFATELKYAMLLTILMGSLIFAQTTSEMQFELAKKMYEDEEYFDTVTELKRLLFFEHVFHILKINCPGILIEDAMRN